MDIHSDKIVRATTLETSDVRLLIEGLVRRFHRNGCADSQYLGNVQRASR